MSRIPSDESVAYKTMFNDSMTMLETYTVFNSRFQAYPSKMATELVRGGIVRMWTVWEAFIHDLLSEAFEVSIQAGTMCTATCTGCNDPSEHDHQSVNTEQISSLHEVGIQVNTICTCGCSTKHLASLNQKWKLSRTIIQAQIKQRMSEKNACHEVIAYNLLREKDCWKNLLREYLDATIRNMQPVFVGENGIIATFQKLFHKKMIVSKDMVDFFRTISFTYTSRECGDVKLQIAELEGLHDTLRLYYGVRCALTGT